MDQKIVLITGATAGIGRYVALHLARKGMRVYATGRNQAALESLRKEGRGLDLLTLRLDVTSEASIREVQQRIDADTDGYGVDVLVNNAGYGLAGPLEHISDAELRRQYDTNVFGLMAVTRAFVGQMRERGSGRILNVSSVGGRVTFPFMGAYNSTKYAIESLSDALRNELAAFGVRVVLIEPGVIRSEFGDRAMNELSRYRDASSPYAPVLARADEIQKQSEAQAVGPRCVAEAIEHASLARRPRARYVAPRRTYAVLAMMKWLPTAWVDAAMRALFGLNRVRLTAGPGAADAGAA